MLECWHLLNVTACSSLCLISLQADKKVRKLPFWDWWGFKTCKPMNDNWNPHPAPCPNLNKNPKLGSTPSSLKPFFRLAWKVWLLSQEPYYMINKLFHTLLLYLCLDIFISRYQFWFLKQFWVAGPSCF